MPAYVTPPLPPEVERIVETLGINRVRLALLLEIRRAPQTIPQLSKRLGVGRVTLNRHMRELEAQGVVTASRPPEPGRRGGEAIAWTMNLGAVVDELERLAERLR